LDTAALQQFGSFPSNADIKSWRRPIDRGGTGQSIFARRLLPETLPDHGGQLDVDRFCASWANLS